MMDTKKTEDKQAPCKAGKGANSADGGANGANNGASSADNLNVPVNCAPAEGAFAEGAEGVPVGGTPVKSMFKRIIITIVAILVAVLVITGIFVAISTTHIYGEAKAINTSFSQLAKQINANDKGGALSSSAEIKRHVDVMDAELEGPTWTFLSCWPILGEMVTKAQKLSKAGSLATSEVLEPYIQALPENASFKLVRSDKSIDAHALQSLLAPLSNCENGLLHLSESLNEIDDFSFWGTGAVYSAKVPDSSGSNTEVAANGVQAKTQTVNLSVNEIFNTAKWAASIGADIAHDSEKYANMLPEMLGENGKRTYLLLAQQNSEVRSTGGFWGSAGVVTVQNGNIKLGKFVSGAHYANYPEPDKNIPETDEEKELFGSRICFIPADTNFVVDFPSAVKRYEQMWVNAGKTPVNGVIALDPVFLQDILSFTGGIVTQNNTVVDGTNAARLLEHDVYYNFSTKEQDSFFAEVAKGVFNRLTGSLSSMDGLCAGKVLCNSFDERRLQIWMKDDNEESLMEVLGCSGALSKSQTNPTLGVYFNNSSYSKLSWWLKSDTQILSSSKNADGSYNYQVKTVIANTLTKKEEQELPDYVASSNKTGACPNRGSMCVWTYLYAPFGGEITNMKTDARICSQDIIDSEVVAGTVDGTMRQASWNGFQVNYAPVQLEAGEVASFTYTITTSAATSVQQKLKIDTTPLGQR